MQMTGNSTTWLTRALIIGFATVTMSLLGAWGIRGGRDTDDMKIETKVLERRVTSLEINYAELRAELRRIEGKIDQIIRQQQGSPNRGGG